MKIYGLIGKKLGHSFSREYFTEKFQRLDLSAEYRNFELSNISQIAEILSLGEALQGFNVTIPYKESIIPYLHEIAPQAQRIGAVNVVKISWEEGEARLKGYNSDYVGFLDSICPLLAPHHRHALILGNGGAANAVRVALEDIGISTLTVSRTPYKGSSIAYQAVTPALLAQYQVIVNTTPLGMYPDIDHCPPIPYEALGTTHLLYDLIYNPAVTLFLQKGKAQGATVQNGREMLIGQAEKAWEIWGSDRF